MKIDPECFDAFRNTIEKLREQYDDETLVAMFAEILPQVCVDVVNRHKEVKSS